MDIEGLQRAARALREARRIVVSAGAGMGVDSGLPDFRGDEGFWKAYPPFGKLGLRFSELANPRWFRTDPELAWGFYGHRLELYRKTVPHAGFGILKRWIDRLGDGGFVFTSNVDGQFQRAGFDEERILECHGSIHHVQCTLECGMPLHSAEGFHVDVDPVSFRAMRPLPSCRRCGGLLRPAILMFGDGGWDGSRSDAQESRLEEWLAKTTGETVIVECGAGTHVPTVRGFSEGLARAARATLVRLNVREPEVPSRHQGPHAHVGLAMGAREALTELDRLTAP